MQFLRAQTLTPPLVRTRRHSVDQLGGLDPLELRLGLGLWVNPDNHFDGKPPGHHPARVNLGLSSLAHAALARSFGDSPRSLNASTWPPGVR